MGLRVFSFHILVPRSALYNRKSYMPKSEDRCMCIDLLDLFNLHLFRYDLFE